MVCDFSVPHAGLATQVSFLTAALMAVALCFHSVLEVRPCALAWVASCANVSPLLTQSLRAVTLRGCAAGCGPESGHSQEAAVAGNGDGRTGQHR